MKAKGTAVRTCLLSLAAVWLLNASLCAFAGEVAKQPAGPKATKKQEESELIAKLKSADIDLFEKDVACRRLAVIGSGDAVPALAALLADERLCDVACYGLQEIRDPAAGDALREALGKVKGRQLAAVATSIGNRRDSKAVADLAKLLKDSDTMSVAAAARALAKIADADAAKQLTEALDSAPDAAGVAMADACITIGETWIVQNKRREATALLDQVRQAKLPVHVRAAATRGAVLARGAGGAKLLSEQLHSDDPEMFAIALRLVRELQGTDVTRELTGQLGKLPPQKQGLLLQALGDRGDRTALPAMLRSAAKGDTQVRVAALKAIAQLGDETAVPVLFQAAVDSNAEVAAAAQTALAGLPDVGHKVNPAIMMRVADRDPNVRRVAIETVGQRQIIASIALLLRAAGDRDEQIRLAAIAALAQMPAVEALSAATALMARPAVRSNACSAAVEIGNKIADKHPAEVSEAMKKVLEATDDANVGKRAKALLDRVGNKASSPK